MTKKQEMRQKGCTCARISLVHILEVRSLVIFHTKHTRALNFTVFFLLFFLSTSCTGLPLRQLPPGGTRHQLVLVLPRV